MAQELTQVTVFDDKAKADLTKKLQKAFETMKSENSLTDAREGIQTFIIYVNNIVKNPNDPKYRRIRIENINYQERLGHLKGGQDMLEILGYEENGSGFLELPKTKHPQGNQDEIKHVQKLSYGFLDSTDESFQNVPWYEHDNSWGCVKAAFEGHDIGRRPSMEDGYMYIDGFAGRKDQGFFAVYDGHGGKASVDFLVCGFHINLAYFLKNNPDVSIPEAFEKVYETTDAQIRRQQILQSGSTSVTCIVRTEGAKRMLYSANVGDARAVLNVDGKAKRLSKDHKASDPDEKKRIEEAGGFVTRFERVNGLLAVSRAFGDHLLKPAVSCVPHQSQHEITKATPFMIIACDGIWDVMTDQEAVDLVAKSLKEKFESRDPGEHPKELQSHVGEIVKSMIKAALDRGSQDNISVMLVYF